MQSLPNELDLLGVYLAGVGGVLLALALLVRVPQASKKSDPRRQVLSLFVLFVLAGSALAVALLGLSRSFALALGGLAAAWTVGWFLQTTFPVRASRTLFGWLRNPRLQALVLLLLSLGAMAAQTWALTPTPDNFLEDQDMDLTSPDIQEVQLAAFTDRGARIPLFAVANPEQCLRSADSEWKMLKRGPMALRVIRIATPNLSSNCHGWIFTGGRFWIRGKDVERILADNGYEQVTSPDMGDVVLYRDGDGNVIHTARVRTVDSEGLVLLESKWGQMGRFLHPPQDQTYSANWTFYRTTRSDHLLIGLNGASPDKQPQPNTSVSLR